VIAVHPIALAFLPRAAAARPGGCAGRDDPGLPFRPLQ